MNATIGRLKKIRLWAIAAVTVGAGVAAAVATRNSLDEATFALKVTSISPDAGPVEGNQDVVISGLDFLKDRVNVTKVAAGGGHALAIDDRGNLYAWGDDHSGQVGDGELTAGHEFDENNGIGVGVLSPIKLTGLEVDAPYVNDLKDAYIVDIAAGGAHSFAVDDKGNIYAWGSDYDGQIGDGVLTRNHLGGDSSADVLAPLKLTGLDTGVYENTLKDAYIVGVNAGAYNSFAYDNQGNLYAWGDDYLGQVGDGASTLNHYGGNINGDVMAPIKLTGLTMEGYDNSLASAFIVKVAVEVAHVLAIDDEGNIYAWGLDEERAVGDGGQILNHETVSSLDVVRAPVMLSGLNTDPGQTNDLKSAFIVDIAAGSQHSMAVDYEGNIYVWGTGSDGQLGVGDYRVNGDPDVYSAPLRLTGFDNVDGSENALRDVKVASVAANTSYSMAIDEDGNLYVWGFEEFSLGVGEILMGGDGPIRTPLNLTALSTGSTYVNHLLGESVSSMAAGGTFAMAINARGEVYAWGEDSNGQVGDGAATEGHYREEGWGLVMASKAVSKNTDSEFPNALYSPADPISVVLGTATCVNIVVVDNTTLTCTTTAHEAGLVDVTVSNGLETVVLAEGYTYSILGVPDTGVGRN